MPPVIPDGLVFSVPCSFRAELAGVRQPIRSDGFAYLSNRRLMFMSTIQTPAVSFDLPCSKISGERMEGGPFRRRCISFRSIQNLSVDGRSPRRTEGCFRIFLSEGLPEFWSIFRTVLARVREHQGGDAGIPPAVPPTLGGAAATQASVRVSDEAGQGAAAGGGAEGPADLSALRSGRLLPHGQQPAPAPLEVPGEDVDMEVLEAVHAETGPEGDACAKNTAFLDPEDPFQIFVPVLSGRCSPPDAASPKLRAPVSLPGVPRPASAAGDGSPWAVYSYAAPL
eukprot:tig00000350_g24354.t1